MGAMVVCSWVHCCCHVHVRAVVVVVVVVTFRLWGLGFKVGVPVCL